MKPTAYNILWLRRDLRLTDSAALYRALKAGLPVQPIFIFDKSILDKLPEDDARVTFIHDALTKIDSELKTLGSGLQVYYGDPKKIWSQLSKDDELQSVYSAKDYEVYAKERDASIKSMLEAAGKQFLQYKDHVIFEYDEVTKDDGKPYTVFTPYKRKWLTKLESRRPTPMDESYYFKSYPCEKYYNNLKSSESKMIALEEMGFKRSALSIPPMDVSQGIIRSYGEQRNFPAVDGTSMLGIHFRFGTISIREKARKAAHLSEVYLSELVWRDFYSMILQHFPQVEKTSFRPQYDEIEWRNDEEDYKKWCEGETGYPIVDAGMRQLNATGYMHNRVRMIVASFLTKHLLIHWTWGERYFAEKLLDFDLASNSGGWQWAAGCGTDAAPYFRVFNPYTQADKFDKERKYIKKWVPEVDTPSYPEAMVDHKYARERCLSVYKARLKPDPS